MLKSEYVPTNNIKYNSAIAVTCTG